MKNTVIKAENLSKTFRLPHERHTTLKQAALHWSKRSYEELEVLSQVSFDVKKGDFFGIVGRNGSGKSTLLKILAGIYQPTSGAVEISGQLTPFIELGVGFDPELSGRDNVFLNGTILGMSKKDIEDKYQSIVDFSELEKFMDQKLKNYSSGMQVRLAFSIAIHAHNDILVLDEVLAVGDDSFQRKCINVFENYKRKDRTVILVTHDMGMVKRFCNKAIMIDSGRIVRRGDPDDVAYAYINVNLDKSASNLKAVKDNKKSSAKVYIEDDKGQKSNKFKTNEEMRVNIRWERLKGVKNIGVAIFKESGEYVFGANTILDKFNVKQKNLVYKCRLNLGVGTYFIKIGFFEDTDEVPIDFIAEGPRFIVEETGELSWQGLTRLEHSWINE